MKEASQICSGHKLFRALWSFEWIIFLNEYHAVFSKLNLKDVLCFEVLGSRRPLVVSINQDRQIIRIFIPKNTNLMVDDGPEHGIKNVFRASSNLKVIESDNYYPALSGDMKFVCSTKAL